MTTKHLSYKDRQEIISQLITNLINKNYDTVLIHSKGKEYTLFKGTDIMIELENVLVNHKIEKRLIKNDK